MTEEPLKVVIADNNEVYLDSLVCRINQRFPGISLFTEKGEDRRQLMHLLEQESVSLLVTDRDKPYGAQGEINLRAYKTINPNIQIAFHSSNIPNNLTQNLRPGIVDYLVSKENPEIIESIIESLTLNRNFENIMLNRRTASSSFALAQAIKFINDKTNLMRGPDNPSGIIVGVGISNIQSDNLYILVVSNEDVTKLSSSDLFPPDFNDLRVEFIAVGVPKAATTPFSCSGGSRLCRHDDPEFGAVSCLVEKKGIKYLLGTSHTMAGSSGAQVGDILCYCKIDSNLVCSEKIDCAALSYYENIYEGNSSNKCDAALALPFEGANILAGIKNVKALKPNLGDPEKGMKLTISSSKTNEKLMGEIDLVATNLAPIKYKNKWIGPFSDVMLVNGINGPIGRGGDSGSIGIDNDGNPVGLFFAGSEELCVGYMFPLKRIFRDLEIDRIIV